ncbi:fimbrial biogenesis chaperone [Stenotrophomonas maltophilia group sp. P373]
MHRLKPVLVVALLLAAPLGRADIGIQETRLVHEADARTVSMRVWNYGKVPALIQSWVDDGAEGQEQSSRRFPFFAAPPLFTLQPDGNRDISVNWLGSAGVPVDRESLYWLNMLSVPASKKKPGEAGVNMDIAVRVRVKLLHRPAGLPGKADDAPAQLQWELQGTGPGSTALVARNPSAYHVSIIALELGAQSIEVAAEDVVKPLSTWSVPVPEALGKGSLQLKGSWVDDAGNAQTLQATVRCEQPWCAAL